MCVCVGGGRRAMPTGTPSSDYRNTVWGLGSGCIATHTRPTIRKSLVARTTEHRLGPMA